MKRKSMTFTETVDVRIDFEDILSELDADDIKSLCDKRGIGYANPLDSEAWRDFADDLRASRDSADRLHFEVLIVRMLAMAGVPRMAVPKKEPVKA